MSQQRMNENQIVVYQPNETVRLDLCAEIIPGLLSSIRKATKERREYGLEVPQFLRHENRRTPENKG